MTWRTPLLEVVAAAIRVPLEARARRTFGSSTTSSWRWWMSRPSQRKRALARRRSSGGEGGTRARARKCGWAPSAVGANDGRPPKVRCTPPGPSLGGRWPQAVAVRMPPLFPAVDRCSASWPSRVGAARAAIGPHEPVRVPVGWEGIRCGRRLSIGRPERQRLPMLQHWEDGCQCPGWRDPDLGWGSGLGGSSFCARRGRSVGGLRLTWSATPWTPPGGGRRMWRQRSGPGSAPALGPMPRHWVAGCGWRRWARRDRVAGAGAAGYAPARAPCILERVRRTANGKA